MSNHTMLLKMEQVSISGINFKRIEMSFSLAIFILINTRSPVIGNVIQHICFKEASSGHTKNHSIPGATLVKNISHPKVSTSTFHLYKSEEPFDWCDGYQFCQSNGIWLALAKDKVTQNVLSTEISRTENVDDFWMSAKRKDFGNDWMWLTDNLTPFYIYNHTEMCGGKDPPKPFCRLSISGDTYLLRDGAEQLKNFVCAPYGGDNKPNGEITWYQAMNACAERNPPSRLAVLDEIVHYHQTGNLGSRPNSYWVGVYYKPWIWITPAKGNVSYVPVYYSSWTRGLDAEGYINGCLAISGHGQWVARLCEEKLNYFLCESINDDHTAVEHTSSVSLRLSSSMDETKKNEPNFLSTHEYITTYRSSPIETIPDIHTPPDEQPTSWMFIIGSSGVVVVLILGITFAVIMCVRKCKRSQTTEQTAPTIIIPLEVEPGSTRSDQPYYSEPDSGYTYIRNSRIYKSIRIVQPDLPPRQETSIEAAEYLTHAV